MSARDDYPIITLHETVDTALIDNEVLSNAYDEIDGLRTELAAVQQSRYEWQRKALGPAIDSFNAVKERDAAYERIRTLLESSQFVYGSTLKRIRGVLDDTPQRDVEADAETIAE